MYKLILCLISSSLSVSAFCGKFEYDIPDVLVESQRKYSGRAIYDMIKYPIINENECNIRVKTPVPNSKNYFTIVTADESIFRFTNAVEVGDIENRRRSRYQCLMSDDLKKLECEKRIPSSRAGQDWDDYVYLALNLDESGIITSMQGKKVRKKRYVFGIKVGWFDEVVTKFNCDIEHPAKVTRDDVKNKSRDGKEKITDTDKKDSVEPNTSTVK